MGYGEIGGGGSVHWHMLHGGNGSVTVHPQGKGGVGRDPVPSNQTPGTFTIWVNNAIVWTGPIDYTNLKQIQIMWTPDVAADRDRRSKEADDLRGPAGGTP